MGNMILSYIVLLEIEAGGAHLRAHLHQKPESIMQLLTLLLLLITGCIHNSRVVLVGVTYTPNQTTIGQTAEETEPGWGGWVVIDTSVEIPRVTLLFTDPVDMSAPVDLVVMFRPKTVQIFGQKANGARNPKWTFKVPAPYDTVFKQIDIGAFGKTVVSSMVNQTKRTWLLVPYRGDLMGYDIVADGHVPGLVYAVDVSRTQRTRKQRM
jgi:hypothetical protein